jgi:sulfotransferase family protein
MGVSVTALARSNAAATDASATAVGITRKPGQPPIVVYIAGSGRSGSTLLERALGEIPGFVNVGELIDLYRRVADHGERCGCGQEFAECQFWSQVGERAVGGWQEQKLAATRDLQGKVARQRRMPRLLAMPLAGSRFRDDVGAYGASYAGLYEAIAAEAGAACVVDASKWPVQALALARAGLDVRVIHLVRDVRGVAYSLGKRDVSRPHAVGEGDVMTRLSPAEAATRWVAVQSQAGLLRRCGLPVARMRYEDFVQRPRQAVEAALAGIGLCVPSGDLAHIGDGRVVLGTSHGLSGNPSRFRDGEIRLRADETWRASMSRRDRLIVTAIALPFMLRYGFAAAGSPAEKQDAHD